MPMFAGDSCMYSICIILRIRQFDIFDLSFPIFHFQSLLGTLW